MTCESAAVRLWLILGAAVGSLITLFLANTYWQSHPVEIHYQQDAIISTHSEVPCPEDHTCEWKAWDDSTNSEVRRQVMYTCGPGPDCKPTELPPLSGPARATSKGGTP
jgi:hypothetical protein